AEGKTRQIGPATDVYALGAVLYDLLTGRPPFLAETPLDIMLRVVSQEPVPPRRLQRKVPRDLETICLKCLQKQPAKRYASAQDLAEDLRRFRADEPIRARPVGVAEGAGRWLRRRPAVAALFVLGLVLSVLLPGGYRQWQEMEAARLKAEQEAAARPVVIIPTAELGGHEWRFTTTDPGAGWERE